MAEAPFLTPVKECRQKDTRPISDASNKINGGGLRKITARAGDFPDPEAEVNGLGKDLVVENIIIRIFTQGQRFQDLPIEGTKTRMIFGKFLPEENVLGERQKAVRYIFIEGHPSPQGPPCENAGPQNEVILS